MHIINKSPICQGTQGFTIILTSVIAAHFVMACLMLVHPTTLQLFSRLDDSVDGRAQSQGIYRQWLCCDGGGSCLPVAISRTIHSFNTQTTLEISSKFLFLKLCITLCIHSTIVLADHMFCCSINQYLESFRSQYVFFKWDTKPRIIQCMQKSMCTCIYWCALPPTQTYLLFISSPLLGLGWTNTSFGTQVSEWYHSPHSRQVLGDACAVYMYGEGIHSFKKPKMYLPFS